MTRHSAIRGNVKKSDFFFKKAKSNDRSASAKATKPPKTAKQHQNLKIGVMVSDERHDHRSNGPYFPSGSSNRADLLQKMSRVGHAKNR